MSVERWAACAALAVGASAILSGCGNSPTVCTEIAIPGIALEVRDSVTYYPAASNAIGVAQDGSFVDTLEYVPTPDPTTLLTMVGAWERQGTYDITVSKTGYLTWHRDSVVVTGDQCHVHTVQIEVLLQPSS